MAGKGINWENGKFKMIVFASDAPVKVAGDGITAGLIAPNDGACHMDNNVYTKEKEFDYPSIGNGPKKIFKNWYFLNINKITTANLTFRHM